MLHFDVVTLGLGLIHTCNSTDFGMKVDFVEEKNNNWRTQEKTLGVGSRSTNLSPHMSSGWSMDHCGRYSTNDDHCNNLTATYQHGG